MRNSYTQTEFEAVCIRINIELKLFTFDCEISSILPNQVQSCLFQYFLNLKINLDSTLKDASLKRKQHKLLSNHKNMEKNEKDREKTRERS